MLDLTRYLNDSSIFVRNQTVRALEEIRQPELSSYITPMLKDSVRAVRISAAHYFNVVGKSEAEQLEEFKTANKEYITELEVNSDLPAGLHQLGVYYQSIGDINKALEYYEKAVKEDNYFNMSRMNLALIYYQQGLVDKSEGIYQKIIEQEPDYSYTYYMLGLLYYETNRKDKALEYLETACNKEPPNESAFYNYALMLQQLNKNNEALTVLKKALNSFSNNERLLYVKLLSEINLNRLNDAINTCRILLQISPNDSNYLQIFQRLQQGNL